MTDADSQLVHDLLPGIGAIGSLPEHHNYKRALIKQPPKHFVVEVLPARKLGNGYAYGMRVHPTSSAGVSLSDAMSTRSGSTSSSSSGSHRTSVFNAPYEIWRRWEDCLWFQDIMEMEYKVMARMKRVRLQQGKGVKKDGMYIHSDQAASFDSLPPGPDANTIAKDIHDIIPKLTKRGTLFRAGKETIELRDREFRAMIEKLWDDEVPMLMKELRDTRLIRDFFGYWRRDRDHDRKAAEVAAGDKGKNRASRASVASSAFSMYFSASNISLQLPGAFSEYPPSPSLASTFTPPEKRGKFNAHAIKKTDSFSSTSSSSAHLSVPSNGKPIKPRIVSIPQSVSTKSIWSNDIRSPTTPKSHLSFTVTDNGAFVPSSPFSEAEDPLNSAILFAPESDSRGKTVGGLHVLPEEQEQELAEGVTELTLSSSPDILPPLKSAPPLSSHPDLPPPVRRPRNVSCPDPGVRNGLVFTGQLGRPQSIASERSVLASPLSATSSEGTQQEHWEDAMEGFANEYYSDAEPETSSRRTSMRSVRTSRSVPRGSPQRPFTMYSTFSSMSQQESFFDDLELGDSIDFEEPVATDESTLTKRSHNPRISVATMNSVMTNTSVDAVLPRRRTSTTSRPKSLHRPASPTPSFTPSTSPAQSYLRSPSPTLSSSPSTSGLGTPGGDVQRRISTGSRRTMRSMTLPEPTELGADEGKWYEGNELSDEDFVDSYFYDPNLHPPRPGYETPRRERVSQTVTQISTPEHFPKPFQHRPPGQFHIPWSPTDSTRTSQVSLSPSILSSPTSASGDHFTIKAVRQESIVLLRATYSMTLAQIRDKLRDKFKSQEGVELTDAFTIGFNSSPMDPRQRAAANAKPGSRARSQSTSAIAALDGQPRLRFITCDEDWEHATLGCSGKITIHIFDRF